MQSNNLLSFSSSKTLVQQTSNHPIWRNPAHLFLGLVRNSIADFMSQLLSLVQKQKRLELGENSFEEGEWSDTLGPKSIAAFAFGFLDG